MESLLPVSAFTVYLAICATGFLFLMIALVFGGLFDFFETDHDFEAGGPGFFSTRVMAVFVTTFGGAGAVATYYGLSAVPSAFVGFGTGLVFGGAIYALARFLYQQQASSEVRSSDLVGTVGRVVIGIPAGGVGQIRVRLGEELMDKIARTRDGVPVAENTSVQIEEVLGETVIVKKN
ncbi:MAG TPA: NfeD family protein [Vicinamibacterales bacterium]|nr:NfeD family protein [Vicinamibacterales bacterium]